MSLFLLGMSKGGFPAGAIALPLLILVWPEPISAARSAVAFMLPLLCVMDLVAFAFYRRHIRWELLRPLFPAMLAGVALAAVLFVSDQRHLIAVSDRGLRILIGIVGISFCLYQLVQAQLYSHLLYTNSGSRRLHILFGFSAGILSTLAHAAGPVMQMYLLPKHLPKRQFAGAAAGFFLVLNAVKLIPFSAMGRFSRTDLLLGLRMLPLIPFGVAAGYGLVHWIPARIYRIVIYSALFVTSVTLLLRA